MTRSPSALNFIRAILIHTSVKLVTPVPANLRRNHRDFNPHEREARDNEEIMNIKDSRILIHTSVKLVTSSDCSYDLLYTILIHTSVKLVT